MKLRMVLGIAGIAIIIAGVAYYVYKNNSEKEKKRESAEVDNGAKDFSAEKDVIDNFEQVDNLSVTKVCTADTITERHEEAKKVMEQSVENILSNEAPEQTKNDEEKRQLFEKIDKL